MSRRTRNAAARAAVLTSAARTLPTTVAAIVSGFVPHEHLPPEWLVGEPKRAGPGPYALAANRYAMSALGQQPWQLLIGGPHEHRGLLDAFLRQWFATHPGYEPPTAPDEDADEFDSGRNRHDPETQAPEEIPF